MESFSGKQKVIVTGGCGFIGSNFLQHMVKKYSQYDFINIDKLTYSGNKENLKDIENFPNYQFIQEDICNYSSMSNIITKDSIVVNFAAESHVDNSITDPGIFTKTNVLGTHTLLEAARKKEAKLFIQISTDEVYGSLDLHSESSTESDLLKPTSPYSASKAAAEMICFGNIKTFKQPIIITRSSNNFGPYQFPEKVIPLFVTNLSEGLKVPLYGTGKNIRDWIHVQDNCEALDFIIHHGIHGEIYNIGGGNEIQNIELTKTIIENSGKDESFITYVEDRLGHDLRYSLDCSKLHTLGWSPKLNFLEAIKETISWYRSNESWWRPLKDMAGKRTR